MTVEGTGGAGVSLPEPPHRHPDSEAVNRSQTREPMPSNIRGPTPTMPENQRWWEAPVQTASDLPGPLVRAWGHVRASAPSRSLSGLSLNRGFLVHRPCHVRARTGGKLRSPAVTHGEYEQPPTWARAG